MNKKVLTDLFTILRFECSVYLCVEVVKFDIAVLVIVLTRFLTGLSDSLNDDANVND